MLRKRPPEENAARRRASATRSARDLEYARLALENIANRLTEDPHDRALFVAVLSRARELKDVRIAAQMAKHSICVCPTCYHAHGAKEISPANERSD